MDNNLTFEQALERLEDIVRTLESGNISLEESLKIYQEGVLLSKLCSQKLEEAEGKVLSIINKEQNQTAAFDLE